MHDNPAALHIVVALYVPLFTENGLFKMSACHKSWSKVAKKLLKEATTREYMQDFAQQGLPKSKVFCSAVQSD